MPSAFHYPPSLEAQLVYSEYFEYDDVLSSGDSIADAPNWVQNTNNMRYQESGGDNQVSFTGSGYVPTHAGGFLESVTGFTGGARGSSSPVGSSLDGEIWVSTFLRPDMTRNYGATAVFGLNDGNVGFGNDNPGFGAFYDGDGEDGRPGTDTITLQIFDGMDPVQSGPVLERETWYLLLARVRIGGATDEIDLWSFSTDADVPTSVAGLGPADLSNDSLDFSSFVDHIYIGGENFDGDDGSGGKTAWWDDIRVANLSGDDGLNAVLIPEPSTYAALFGLFALGMVFWIRRKRS
ncbi:MAG: PEP-CTERM sorting domain-containing protein [Opitutales bacterium]|nr:PEP-CTERM sorting domain-containing protein [Opitutales bacterium]